MSAPFRGSLVVMGVSASGKTTLAKALAWRWGLPFADADDHHPAANRQKMAAGIPLDDADRGPWLAALAALLGEGEARGTHLVLACSALKRVYRDVLRAGAPAGSVRFLHLDVPPAELEARLLRRKGHFFSPALLASQLAALEPPDEQEATTLHVRGGDDLTALIARAEERLRAPSGPR